MPYELLADVVLVAHVGVVAFVILGQLLVVTGALLGWRWVRSPWFRLPHVALICYIAWQALNSIVCPLTTWEWQLRHLADPANVAGEATAGAMRFLQSILFYPLDVSHPAFSIGYTVFAALVVLTLFLAPPRLRFFRGAGVPPA